MAINALITPEVREMLEQAIIKDNAVHFSHLMERTLYVAVNKHLENLGGKWNKKQKCHLFEVAPGPLLEKSLEEGKSVNAQQRDQTFYTPPDIARKLAEMAGVSGKRVLEPSAGKGALAVACTQAGASGVTCFDILPDNVKTLVQLGFSAVCVDFLSLPPSSPHCGGLHYDRVMMNPPFTRHLWLLHIRHALQFIVPGGKLVSIVPGNAPDMKGFVKSVSGSIAPLPKNAFASSGTTIDTAILSILC